LAGFRRQIAANIAIGISLPARVWHNFDTMEDRRQPRNGKRPLSPLDAAALRSLALSYVGRYATTRARLDHYLRRKLRERGWADEAPFDSAALADDFVRLGYVDDASFAASRTASLLRRGYGPARVSATLSQAGIEAETVAKYSTLEREDAVAAARAFARRKRIGPFGPPIPDRKAADRALAAMLRAGHRFEIAREVLSLSQKMAETESP
jgi:regulatory protein